MILIPMRPIRPASFSPTPATPSTLLLTMSGSKGPLMFKDPLIDANRKRFGPFLLEPLEPRWFLDAIPLDLPATVQGSFPQTYDVALKAGLLYRFDANQGWIKIDCLDWHSY